MEQHVVDVLQGYLDAFPGNDSRSGDQALRRQDVCGEPPFHERGDHERNGGERDQHHGDGCGDAGKEIEREDDDDCADGGEQPRHRDDQQPPVRPELSDDRLVVRQEASRVLHGTIIGRAVGPGGLCDESDHRRRFAQARENPEKASAETAAPSGLALPIEPFGSTGHSIRTRRLERSAVLLPVPDPKIRYRSSR